jgi:hypothetical protein
MTKFIKTIALILLIGISTGIRSQSLFGSEDDVEKKGTMFSGGTLSLMFGTTTFLDVSPHFGYYITNRLSVAGGFTYAYYSEKLSQNYTFEESIYGGRVFARFDAFKQFFAHAELEGLNIKNYQTTTGINLDGDRRWLYSPLVGLGYKQSFSDLSGMYIMMLWNFDETLDYPYGNPILRIGFEYGW